jgi:hypothetical protein
MTEAMDMDGRLDQLVRAGLMPTSSLPLLKRAISRMHAGMSLQGAERDVMNMFISSMMFIVLGDDTVFNKARAGAKTYATEAKEKTEYDYEGDMAMGQLKSIIANSQRMHDMLSDDTNLPEWVQSKITLAEDYISTASNYMQGEMNEEKMPFEGPYRKVGERKDKYGNTVKNVPKFLAKKAMNKQKNEEIDPDLEAELKATRVTKKSMEDSKKTRERASGMKEEADYSEKGDAERIRKRQEGWQKTFDAEKAMQKKAAAIKHANEFLKRYNKEEVDEETTYSKDAVEKELNKSNVKPKNRKLYHAIMKGSSGYKAQKEEVESIDELSTATLKSYRTKARADAYDADDVDDNRRFRKRAAGSNTAGKKLVKRDENLRAEEVEQVDEISKATMGRYINKAKDSIDMTSYRSGIKDGTAISSSTPYKSNNPLEKKLTKRHKGIETAVKKLTKEEIEGLEEYAVSKTPPTARTLKPEVKPTMNPAFKPKTRQSSVGTLARVRSGMAKRSNNGNVKEDIDAVKQMNESYKTAFETALTEYGIKSPSELDESKRKEFFNHVDLEFKKGDN